MVIKCRDRLLDLSHPVVMGILNITPDSFFDGGKYKSIEEILNQTRKMVSQGAKIIDIGGMSSRPGAKSIPSEVELGRILEPVKQIRKEFPQVFISVDTIYGKTAQKVLEAGADIINDISAFTMDRTIIEMVNEFDAGYILMHMSGTPENMQIDPNYDNLIREILHFFIHKIEELNDNKVDNIIVDPGFGFGKTILHNYELLSKMSMFRILERPIMAGLSRKSMFHKFLGIKPEDCLPATSVGNYIALSQGTKIMRVHDVREAMQVIKIHNNIN